MFDFDDATKDISDVYIDLAKLLRTINDIPAETSEKGTLLNTLTKQVTKIYIYNLEQTLAGTRDVLTAIENSYAIEVPDVFDAVEVLKTKLLILDELPREHRAQIDAGRTMLLQLTALLAKVDREATREEKQALSNRENLDRNASMGAVTSRTVDHIEKVFSSRPRVLARDIADIRKWIERYDASIDGAEIIRPNFGGRM